jgi:6-phosphogluconolactonase/glucosamine-6-phosphate isomerase/deaminase
MGLCERWHCGAASTSAEGPEGGGASPFSGADGSWIVSPTRRARRREDNTTNSRPADGGALLERGCDTLMIVKRCDTRSAMAQAAAAHAASSMRAAIAARGRARIVVATGASQFEFLQDLTENQAVDWTRVTLFHLDEYVGLPITHPASFRKYILERVIEPVSLRDYVLLDGEGDPAAVCREAGAALNEAPVDVAFVGIGENGRSTILRPTSPPTNRTSSSNWITPAGGSRSERAGSGRARRCPSRRSRCRSGRS